MELVADRSLVLEELNPVQGWDAVNSFTTDRRWRGSLAQCQAMADTLVGAGGVMRLQLAEESPAFWLLTATYSGKASTADGSGPPPDPNSTITTRWARPANVLQKTIWAAPKLQAIWARLFSDVASRLTALQAWRQDVEEWLAGASDPDTSVETLMPAGLTAEDQAALREFLLALLHGVESITLGQYVVRRTRLCPRGATVQPNDQFTGHAYSLAGLVAAEHPPADLQFALPDGYYVRQPAQVDQLEDGRYQIVEEWWHADALDPFVFDPVS